MAPKGGTPYKRSLCRGDPPSAGIIGGPFVGVTTLPVGGWSPLQTVTPTLAPNCPLVGCQGGVGYPTNCCCRSLTLIVGGTTPFRGGTPGLFVHFVL